MKLRIAKKICKYMGHGYPIDNICRLEKAVSTWKHACERFKHWQRDLKYEGHGGTCGKPGQFSDSDKRTAENFGIDYMDVEDFVKALNK